MSYSSVRWVSVRPLVLGLAGAIIASLACDNREQSKRPTANPAGSPTEMESTPPDRVAQADVPVPPGTVTDGPQLMASTQTISGVQTPDSNQAEDKPTARAVIEGNVHRELRGWVAPGKVIVTIDLPFEIKGTLELGTYVLRGGEQLLGDCIGIVPSTDVQVAYAGHLVELRDSDAIPIEDLRPAIDVKEEDGSNLTLVGDLLIESGQGFFWQQSRTQERFVVGQGLILTPESDRHVFITASGPTYVLFSDGWHISVAHDEKAERAGIRLSAPEQLRMVFAIRDTETSMIELVRESAAGSEVLGQVKLSKDSAPTTEEGVEQPTSRTARADIYHHQPANRTTQAASKSIQVVERNDGALEITLAKDVSDGNLAAIMDGSGNSVTYLPDALGSRDIRVIVDRNVGRTTLAGLKFRSDCIVNIWPDGTIEVDREGVAASGERDARYVSRTVVLDGRASIVMVREVSAQAACEPIVFEGIETESGSSRFDGDLSIQEETEDGKTYFRVKPLCGRSLPTILRDGGSATVSLFRVGGNHVLIGTLEHSGYVFESDLATPLVFKLMDGGRYVYLCGRGRVGKAPGEMARVGYDIDDDQWLARLKSKDATCRSGAAWSFAWSKDQRGVPGLVAALHDPEAEVRRHAAAALGAIGDPSAIQALAAALGDEDAHVRYTGAVALACLGSRGVSALTAALNSQKEKVRLVASEVLGEIDDESVNETLIERLSGSTSDVRPVEQNSSNLSDLSHLSVNDLRRLLSEEIESGTLDMERLTRMKDYVDAQLQRVGAALDMVEKAGEDGWAYTLYADVITVVSGSATVVTREEWSQLIPAHKQQLRNYVITTARHAQEVFDEVNSQIETALERKQSAHLKPAECWLSGEAWGTGSGKPPDKGHVFLWVKLIPIGETNSPGKNCQLAEEDVALFTPQGKRLNAIAMRSHEPSDAPKSKSWGVSWAFDVAVDQLKDLARFKITLKDGPPVDLAPVLRPFDLKPGNEVTVRWPGSEGKRITGFKDGRPFMRFEIIPSKTTDWFIAMTGPDGKNLRAKLSGSPLQGDFKFLWIDQPFEIRDSQGNVLYKPSHETNGDDVPHASGRILISGTPLSTEELVEPLGRVCDP